MPRPPKGRVGRSAGVAEHRVAKHRICHQAVADDHLHPRSARSRASSRSRSRVRRARSPRRRRPTSIASTRARDRRDREPVVRGAAPGRRPRPPDPDARPGWSPSCSRVDRLREVADARAVQLYESNTQAFGVDTDVMGDDPLELGRRAALIGQANANGQAVIDELEASISDLDARARELRDGPSRPQAQTLQRPREPAARPSTRELASLQLRSARAARPHRAGGRDRAGDETAHDRRADPRRARRDSGRAAPHRRRADSGRTAPDTGVGQPAPRRPVPRVHPGPREQRQLQRRELVPGTTAPTSSPPPPGTSPRRTRAGSISSACCRRPRRSTTRTRWRGRSTSGRATRPGADAADPPIRATRRAIASASEHVGE